MGTAIAVETPLQDDVRRLVAELNAYLIPLTPREFQFQLTVEQMAEQLEISKEDYEQIEAGQSGIEEYGPLLLHYAEIIEQPVFNLFYPCGLPLEKLDDYP